jgi:hypothetical protein
MKVAHKNAQNNRNVTVTASKANKNIMYFDSIFRALGVCTPCTHFFVAEVTAQK